MFISNFLEGTVSITTYSLPTSPDPLPPCSASCGIMWVCVVNCLFRLGWDAFILSIQSHTIYFIPYIGSHRYYLIR